MVVCITAEYLSRTLKEPLFISLLAFSFFHPPEGELQGEACVPLGLCIRAEGVVFPGWNMGRTKKEQCPGLGQASVDPFR